MISRRFVLAGLMAGFALPGLALPDAAQAEGPKTSPRPLRRGQKPQVAPKGSLADVVAAAKLTGVTGLVVVEAATGRVIEAIGERQVVPPASVAKTITALYALERLGPDYRFHTRLMATGPVVGGIVQGDLVLHGGGDPMLNTDDLGDMAQALAAAGVKGITGRYVADAGALPAMDYIAPGQPPQVGYDPGLSGLNLNFNRVNFEWKRQGKDYALSMDARGERFLPPVRMAKVSLAAREVPIFTYDRKGEVEAWTVASAALGKGGSRWLPVRQPALYTAEVFQTLAAAQGITLPDAEVKAAGVMASAPMPAGAANAAEVPGGTVLVDHASPPLTDVLRDMLKYSTNLTAEVVGLTASGAGSQAASAQAMTEWAAERLGMTSTFGDHSGLGPVSRVTPMDMAEAIVAALKTPSGARLPEVLRDVKMRDEKGDPAKESPIRVVGKSGTLNFVSGLAGIITPPGGKEMVFAIFSADVPRRDAVPMDQREEPPGGHAWVTRARKMQGKLINRWATSFA